MFFVLFVFLNSPMRTLVRFGIESFHPFSAHTPLLSVCCAMPVTSVIPQAIFLLPFH